MRIEQCLTFRHPNKQRTSTQLRFYVGPPSATLAQHETDVVLISCFARLALTTGYWPNAGWLLAHRLRRWANIHPALGIIDHVVQQKTLCPASVVYWLDIHPNIGDDQRRLNSETMMSYVGPSFTQRWSISRSVSLLAQQSHIGNHKHILSSGREVYVPGGRVVLETHSLWRAWYNVGVIVEPASLFCWKYNIALGFYWQISHLYPAYLYPNSTNVFS